jgi:hypothetical protein
MRGHDKEGRVREGGKLQHRRVVLVVPVTDVLVLVLVLALVRVRVAKKSWVGYPLSAPLVWSWQYTMSWFILRSVPGISAPGPPHRPSWRYSGVALSSLTSLKKGSWQPQARLVRGAMGAMAAKAVKAVGYRREEALATTIL